MCMNCVADAPGYKSRVQGAFRLLSYYIKSERGSLVCSRMARDSTPRFVGPSIRRSIGPSVRPSVLPSIHNIFEFPLFLIFLWCLRHFKV